MQYEKYPFSPLQAGSDKQKQWQRVFVATAVLQACPRSCLPQPAEHNVTIPSDREADEESDEETSLGTVYEHEKPPAGRLNLYARVVLV